MNVYKMVLLFGFLWGVTCQGQFLPTSNWPEIADKLYQGNGKTNVRDSKLLPAGTSIFQTEYDISWIKKALDEAWWPATFEPHYYPAEYKGRNVVRHFWTKSGYYFETAQTRGFFTLRVRPVAFPFTLASKEERFQHARDFFLSLLAKQGARYGKNGITVKVEKLNEKIVASSFSPECIHEIPGKGLLVGRPKTREDEKVEQSEDPEQLDVQAREDNPNWFHTSGSWMYWFRYTFLWTEGETCGLFFVKCDAGPVVVGSEGEPLKISTEGIKK